MNCKICQGKLVKIPAEFRGKLVVYSCTNCGETFYDILDELHTTKEIYKMKLESKCVKD